MVVFVFCLAECEAHRLKFDIQNEFYIIEILMSCLSCHSLLWRLRPPHPLQNAKPRKAACNTKQSSRRGSGYEVVSRQPLGPQPLPRSAPSMLGSREEGPSVATVPRLVAPQLTAGFPPPWTSVCPWLGLKIVSRWTSGQYYLQSTLGPEMEMQITLISPLS